MKRFLNGCATVVAYLLLLLFLILLGVSAYEDQWMWEVALGYLLGCTVGFFWVVMLHELGHGLAGLRVGFRFELMAIGPVQIRRQETGLTLHFGRPVRGYAGAAVLLPTDTERLPQRAAVMIAGGPAASLISGGATIALYRLLGVELLDHTGDWFAVLLLIVAVGSFFTFLGTVVPFRHRGLLSDGAQFLPLMGGGPRAERHGAIWALMGLARSGVRARERPSGLVQAATVLPDGSPEDTIATYLAYFSPLDRGEIDVAAALLDRAFAARESLPAIARAALYLEAAYFTARFRGDATVARAYLDQSKDAVLLRPWPRNRAAAEVLLAEGRHEEAHHQAVEGLASIEAGPGWERASSDAERFREIVARGAAAETGDAAGANGSPQ